MCRRLRFGWCRPPRASSLSPSRSCRSGPAPSSRTVRPPAVPTVNTRTMSARCVRGRPETTPLQTGSGPGAPDAAPRLPFAPRRAARNRCAPCGVELPETRRQSRSPQATGGLLYRRKGLGSQRWPRLRATKSRSRTDRRETPTCARYCGGVVSPLGTLDLVSIVASMTSAFFRPASSGAKPR